MKLKCEETAVWTTDDDVKIELTTSQTEAKLVLTRRFRGDSISTQRVEVTVSVDDLLAMADRARDMLRRLGVEAMQEMVVSYPADGLQMDPERQEEWDKAIALLRQARGDGQ